MDYTTARCVGSKNGAPTEAGEFGDYSVDPAGSCIWTWNSFRGTWTRSSGPDWIILSPSQAATTGTAINNAQAALGANGGTIYIPKLSAGAAWTLDTGVRMTQSGIRILGASQSATLVQFDPTVVPTAFAMADTTQRWGSFENFRIITTSAGTGQGTAIDASYFTNFRISDMRIGTTGQAPNKGLIYNATGSFYNTARDLRIQVAGVGSQGLAYDNSSNGNVTEGVIRIIGDANTVGCYVNSHSVRLGRIDIESNCATGIQVGPLGHECKIGDPYLEAVQGTGLLVDGTVQMVKLDGGFIADSTGVNVNYNANTSFKAAARVQYAPFFV